MKSSGLRTIAITLILLSTALAARAQSIVWEKTFGTQADAHEVQQTADGGFIVVGTQGATAQRIYLVKTTSSGNRMWEKMLGKPEDFPNGSAVQPMPDGSFIIGGGSGSYPMIMKVSSTGDSLWSKVYGSGHGSVGSLVRTSDGGIVAAAYTYAPDSSTSNLYLFKVDAGGTLQWERHYGGADNDGGNAVRQTSDGGLVVAGWSGVPGSSDPYLLKTDASGNRTWEKTYPGIHSTNDGDEATDVRQTADGGYILTGRRATSNASFETDLFLLKTDAAGARQWEKRFGGAGFDGGNSVRQTSDGGYIVTGFDNATATYSGYRIYVVRTDADGIQQSDLRPRDGYGHSVLLAGDGSAVVAGGSAEQAYLGRFSLPVPGPPRYFVIADALGNPIPNQEFTLYRGTMKPGNDREITRQTTDAQGRIRIDPAWYRDGDSVRIAKIVFTQPTLKPLHDAVAGVAYRVMLDNVRFNEKNTFPLTDVSFDIYNDNPSVTEQRIVLGHTTVLYDLIVSIEWDADDAFIADIARGIPVVANYLYDVSDGQIGLGKVVIVENGTWWNGADVLIHATTEMWPFAGLEGFLRPDLGDDQQVKLPPRWYGRTDLVRRFTVKDDWLATYTEDNWRNFAHELGHQLLGFRDEYNDLFGRRFADDYNLGFMDSQFTPELQADAGTDYLSQIEVVYSTEMSSKERYRTSDQKSRQFLLRGSDCWTDFEKRYEKSYGGIFCPIVKPSERTGTLGAGALMMLGPNDRNYAAPSYDAGSMLQMTIYANTTKLFAGTTTVTTSKDGGSVPFPMMQILLKKPTRTIDLGMTNPEGRLRLLGAQAGDQYIGSGTFDGGIRTFTATVPAGAAKDGKAVELASIDTVVAVTARPVEGIFTFVPTLAYGPGTTLDLGLVINREFTQDPTIRVEIDSVSSIDRVPGFSVQQSAYALRLDSLPGSGLAILTGYDDARQPFPAFLRYSTGRGSSEIHGDNGGVVLTPDTAGTTLDRFTWISSALPTPSGGLDGNARRAGNVHALALSAPGALGSGAGLTIRYANEEVETLSESSLRIFRWSETLRKWEKIGGTVDTVHNEVTALISTAGTYAAFTTNESTGIRSNDNSGESLSIAHTGSGLVLELTIVRRAPATLTLFNSLGQPMTTLVTRELSPGSHRLMWEIGRIPSGVYYCRLQTATGVRTVKIVL
jgi:hypothetical protein